MLLRICEDNFTVNTLLLPLQSFYIKVYFLLQKDIPFIHPSPHQKLYFIVLPVIIVDAVVVKVVVGPVLTNVATILNTLK